MNLSFLKVRVADCPWILFDRLSMPRGGPGDVDDEVPWASVAVDICSRTRGAAADGIAVLRMDGGAATINTWTSAGEPSPPSPVAILCASRLVFDAGMAGAESIGLRSPFGLSEVIVIDSRNFGLPMGEPLRSDGRPLDGAFGTSGLGLSAFPGSGVVVPLLLGGSAIEVALFDRPPARRPARRTDRVEVLSVSRHELRVRRGSHDPVVAAAAAAAAAIVADYADRETGAAVGGDDLVIQWPEGGPVFVAAAPSYCLSGEFWATDPRSGF